MYYQTIKGLEQMLHANREIVKVEQLRRWVICTLDNGTKVWFKSF